ncbi:hypothetical protein T265_09352 [Opisthorchis viverrini]|uniref:Uncharacterized protein n=1 Tax=Opisthorchis viverrini TaxID=6198 RepID=A0A074Z621_OPIVI|nr:hypothetical protein T265_09352 [Opisthorchis viverrini]KER22591.1 hypothetical protein T265_09352 [Opisthorchis viverrini]
MDHCPLQGEANSRLDKHMDPTANKIPLSAWCKPLIRRPETIRISTSCDADVSCTFSTHPSPSHGYPYLDRKLQRAIQGRISWNIRYNRGQPKAASRLSTEVPACFLRFRRWGVRLSIGWEDFKEAAAVTMVENEDIPEYRTDEIDRPPQ